MALAVLATGGALYAIGQGHIEIALPTLAAVTAAAVGSLVPDIDHPKAWISNRIPAMLLAYGFFVLVGFGFIKGYSSALSPTAAGAPVWTLFIANTRPFLGSALLAVVLGVGLLAIAGAVANFVEHRGPTHSLVVGLTLTLVACIGFAFAPGPWTIGLWFGWGFLSHLLADLITPMGCPALLWPAQFADTAGSRSAGRSTLERRGRKRPTSTMGVAVAAAGGSVLPADGFDHQGGTPNTTPQTQAGEIVPDSLQVGEAVQPIATRQLENGRSTTSDSAPLGLSVTRDSRLCPKCGGALVLRRARRGAHTGSAFYGCVNYPRCRHIEDAAG